MFSKTETKFRDVSQVINGESVTIRERYTAPKAPRIPGSLDEALKRGLIGAAVVILTGAVVWSAVAIGSLLSGMAPAWAAYMMATVFDLSWILCLVGAWVNRYNPKTRSALDKAGWVFLAITMAAIFTHGLTAGSWVVGLFGAMVSLVAKGVWMVATKSLSPNLDKHHLKYLNDKIQEAQVKQVFAQMDGVTHRTLSRVAEYKAAIGSQPVPALLVAESSAPPMSLTETTPQPAVSRPETHRESAEAPGLVSLSPVETRRKRLEDLSGYLKSGETLTGRQVADMFGVSPQTGYRDLKDAKALIESERGVGNYL